MRQSGFTVKAIEAVDMSKVKKKLGVPAGLASAAARGRKGGRKPVITAERLQRAREHIANGLNVREAAARLKVGKTALYAALQAASAANS